jgi:hypothetical protein
MALLSLEIDTACVILYSGYIKLIEYNIRSEKYSEFF